MLLTKNEKTKVTAAVTVWFFVIAVMATLVVAQVEPASEAAVVVDAPEPASGRQPEVLLTSGCGRARPATTCASCARRVYSPASPAATRSR